MDDRQQRGVMILDRLVGEQQERDLQQVIRIVRVIGRRRDHEDAPTARVMRAELAER